MKKTYLLVCAAFAAALLSACGHPPSGGDVETMEKTRLSKLDAASRWYDVKDVRVIKSEEGASPGGNKQIEFTYEATFVVSRDDCTTSFAEVDSSPTCGGKRVDGGDGDSVTPHDFNGAVKSVRQASILGRAKIPMGDVAKMTMRAGYEHTNDGWILDHRTRR